MQEREQYHLAVSAAKTMYQLWELENQAQKFDLDNLMRRLKDLSAFPLTHAEIMDQRERVELSALGIFFGVTSNPRFHHNQVRLSLPSEQTIAYQGKAKVIKIYDSMNSGAIPMPGSNLSVVQEKGQVTIPVEIRRKLGLKKGDLVAFIETEQGVLISPQEIVAMETLDKLGEMLKEKGISLEELIDSGREVRGEIAREKYDLDAQDD
jgi:antitoxin PrlF